MNSTDGGPSYYGFLEFNAPLSDQRANALAAAIARRRPQSVLDIGCGWAELLLRIVAAAPDARGLGVDSDERLIERGRANAAARGLSDRVELRASDGTEPLDPADAVTCIGSDHVFGTQVEALAALRPLVRPGGVLLFGTGYWQRPPTVDGSCRDSARLRTSCPTSRPWSTRCVAAGFRPLDLQTANEDEWNAFESGYLADDEEYLMTHASDDDAAACRRASHRLVARLSRRARLRLPDAWACRQYGEDVTGVAQP